MPNQARLLLYPYTAHLFASVNLTTGLQTHSANRVDSVQASEVEINVDDTIVTVHINPYFLRLNFPGNLIEDDASGAQYDPSSGYLHVTLTKEVKDEDFKDLDLLAKLLAPRPNTDKGANPTIEVLASEETVSDVEENLSSQIEGLSLDAERQEILKGA